MININTILHETELLFDDFITDLMQSRVRQGHPEKITIIVDGELQTAYNWTDGIGSALSVFIPVSQGTIREICIAK
jgi:hypothetical protein